MNYDSLPPISSNLNQTPPSTPQASQMLTSQQTAQPNSRSNKKIISIILGITAFLFLAILVGVGVYIFSTANKSQQSVFESSGGGSLSFKTYRSLYGFQLQVPSAWELSFKAGTPTFSAPQQSEGVQNLVVVISQIPLSATDSDVASQMKEGFLASSGATVDYESRTDVNGIAAFEVKGTTDGPGGREVSRWLVGIPIDDGKILVTFIFSAYHDELSVYEEFFRNIVKAFRYTGVKSSDGYRFFAFDDYGVSFEYPAGLTREVSEVSDGSVVRFSTSSRGLVEFRPLIVTAAPAQPGVVDSLATWKAGILQGFQRTPEYKVTETLSTTIGGLPAEEVRYRLDSAGVQVRPTVGRVIGTFKDNNIIVSFTMVAYEDEYTEAATIFSHIVESVRFADLMSSP